MYKIQKIGTCVESKWNVLKDVLKNKKRLFGRPGTRRKDTVERDMRLTNEKATIE